MMNKKRRRRIGVPRGMLRHLALQILKKGPMSGSEIVDQIEEYTDWRPSPGSIYPLMSILQEEDLIRPYEDMDQTLKRFELTEKGVKIVNEIIDNDPHIRNRQYSIRKMFWKLHMGMSESLYSSFDNFMLTLEDIFLKVRDDPEASFQLNSAIESATLQIKEVEA